MMEWSQPCDPAAKSGSAPDTSRSTLDEIASRLASGSVTSRDLVLEARSRIEAHPDGQRIFPHSWDPDSLRQADLADSTRRSVSSPRLSGIPISIKDNIAQQGVPLGAGTRFLEADGDANDDAEIVRRVKAAGLIVIGRTGMTELAFSGLGLNPHFGTPANPAMPSCAPGGSSSGAAVSVAAGLAAVAVGTDTSGSCRIPAAFCNLVGFKPTAARIPLTGVFPLSPTLDSVGVIGRSVDCCASVDAILADIDAATRPSPPLAALRFADLSPILSADTDPRISAACNAAIDRLRASGIVVEPATSDLLTRISKINSCGGFGAAELYRHLQDRLPQIEGSIDPRVLRRIEKGARISDLDAAGMRTDRRELIDFAENEFARFDAVLMPTVAIAPPALEALAMDEEYDRINLIALRNAGIANMLDRCAVSIPCGTHDGPPVGLTLMGRHGEDRELLSLASALESTIRGRCR